MRVKFLRSKKLSLSINTLGGKIKVPDFQEFRNKFKFGNRFVTSGSSNNNFEDFTPSTSYSGFQINFIFASNLFRDSLSRHRNFFTASFEAGRSNTKLYRMITADSSRLGYDFDSDIFRLSIGYKYFITYKRRIRFYTGLEVINEFNISASIKEKAFAESFTALLDERRLFAKKNINVYANVPLGVDFRLFRRASIFFHVNLAFGSQNADPLRFNKFFTGFRLGISLYL